MQSHYHTVIAPKACPMDKILPNK